MQIAITGPENSGKSALSVALAKSLSCSYTPEYARFYLQEHSWSNTREELNKVIQGQIDWMHEAASTPQKHQVFDTDLFVLEVWEEVRFHSCSLAVQKAKHQLELDLILICHPDLPWEDDPLRESKDELHLLYTMYVDRVKASGIPFGEIKGSHRLDQALRYIQQKRGSLS